MAVRLEPTDLIEGYFWTTDFDQITNYVCDYLDYHQHSIYFVVHASAIFTSDDNEDREIHMAPSSPELFDPDMPRDVLRNQIELKYDEMHEPEGWEGLESSGWTIVPGSFTYWFKIIQFQPNNTPSEHGKNRKDGPDYDDDVDPDDPPADDNQPRPVREKLDRYNTLLLSIANYHVPNTGRLSNIRLYPVLHAWLEERHFKPNELISPGNIANWHERVGQFNLRIFSEHGNVIYCKNMDDSDEFIDIIWSNRRFKLITNLWSLLGEKRDRVFCNLCRKFHRQEESCRQTIASATSDTVYVPEYPRGRHACVTYADFESIVQVDNKHFCSGFAFIMVDKEGIKIQDSYCNAMDTDCSYHEGIRVETVFMDHLFQASYDYAFLEMLYQGGGDLIGVAVGTITGIALKSLAKRMRKTFICPLCNEEVGDLQRYVTGKNFINGGYGKHHKACWEDPKNACVTYFHNFKGYDSHYILREIMRLRQYEVSFIRGKSFEKFDIISVTKQYPEGQIRITFKDTFNYLSTSIAKLVKNVETWKYTDEEDRQNKGTFPYKWFNDFDKLNYTALPGTDEWFNDITQSDIDPQPAIDLWNKKQFANFGEFHDYYMRVDVKQLADIFEEFRDACISSSKTDTEDGLDPVYFQGAPGYTWQKSLELVGEKMHIIPDVEVYIDIQQNIRGGISQVMHRYVNIEKDKDKTMLYLDVNSLYSACMTEKLPTKYLGTKYTLPDEWQEIYSGTSSMCAFMCVDLDYPEHLHDLHTAYPLAPHKYNGRLCTTFLPKYKYLVHSECLKFYLAEGMILTKFHYMYLFDQDYILKDYVSSNIDKRRATNSAPLKTLYKLLNNSLYGKTCENKFKYRKFDVHTEERGVWGKINTYLIDAVNWLPMEDKVLVEHRIKRIILDKPIQIGFAILELAKLKMYEFLFNVQKVFPDVKPLYTDTDSLLLLFNHPSPEEELFNNPLTKPLLDFDKVPESWRVHTPGTHKQSGLWSLETTERVVEFIGIRAKTYCYRTDSNKTVLRNKGITSHAIELNTRKKLTIEHYKDVLFKNKEIRVHQVLIASKKHNIINRVQTKLALSNNDEKRQVLPDKITTVPFGYKGERYAEYISDDKTDL